MRISCFYLQLQQQLFLGSHDMTATHQLVWGWGYQQLNWVMFEPNAARRRSLRFSLLLSEVKVAIIDPNSDSKPKNTIVVSLIPKS